MLLGQNLPQRFNCALRELVFGFISNLEEYERTDNLIWIMDLTEEFDLVHNRKENVIETRKQNLKGNKNLVT